MGSDLPDFSENARKLNDETRETISRKMSFILRGWSNTKNDGKALVVIFRDEKSFGGFRGLHDGHKKVYPPSITVTKVADVVKVGTKSRLEILASPDEGLGPRFRWIRAIQGDWRMVIGTAGMCTVTLSLCPSSGTTPHIASALLVSMA